MDVVLSMEPIFMGSFAVPCGTGIAAWTQEVPAAAVQVCEPAAVESVIVSPTFEVTWRYTVI